MSYVLIQAKVCYSLIRFRVNHSTWDYYFECRNIQGSGHASRTLLLFLLWNQSMIGSFWTLIYFLRARHGDPQVTKRIRFFGEPTGYYNSFGEFGPKIFENRIGNVDNKISSQSTLFSTSKDFSQSKCFVTKLSIILRVSILKIIIILLGPRMICPIPMIWLSVLPARAENDLLDPNNYD